MVIQFGAFEFDDVAYRLTREGLEVRLAQQPLDLLIFLIGRRGELVTREDIHAQLWPAEPDIDIGRRINTAIQKVRAALDDNSDSPQYIETVVRRGYRFIAPVTTRPECEAVSEQEISPVPELVAAEQPRAGSNLRQLRLPWIGVAAGLTAAAILAWALLSRQRLQASPPVLTWRPITKAVHLITRIAADSANVFWTECTDAGCRPWKAPLDGAAEAAPVPTPFPNAFVMDATERGRLLLSVPEKPGIVGARGFEGDLWEADAALGATRRIGALTASGAAWSPDGNRIAFITRAQQLWIANRDGSDSHRIAELSGDGDIVNPVWRPDGKLLRFVLHPNTEFRYPLWEVETGGSARPALPEWKDGSEPFAGAWMQDGRFVFGERGEQKNLWEMVPANWPLPGHRLEQLTRGPLEFSDLVRVPGRNDLAVVGSRKQGELVRFDAREHRFEPFLKGISAEMEDFSRDGQWVVYIAYPERDLWRSRVDGTEALQLTHGPLHAGMPRISPDNKAVAFSGDYSGKQMRIWLVPFEGGEPKPATDLEPGTAELAPMWSPDGNRLLYRLDPTVRQHVLRILDLASGHIETVPGSENKVCQRWSPDGEWLIGVPSNGIGIDAFNFASQQWTTVTTMAADFPAWSRDSRSLYFITRFESGEQAIYRVSLFSHNTERVASLAGTTRAFNETYGQWMGLAPDDSPLILRSADLQQIYLLSFSSR